jgi:hypothetical protein
VGVSLRARAGMEACPYAVSVEAAPCGRAARKRASPWATTPRLVIARAEGPWQSIGFHPRDDVSLPFLPERRMAFLYYRASLLGLVQEGSMRWP